MSIPVSVPLSVVPVPAILAAATQPFSPETGGESGLAARLVSLGVVIGLSVLGVLVAKRAGVFRRRSVDGPVRLGPDRPGWPFFGVFIGAGVMMIFAANIVASVRQAQLKREQGPDAKIDFTQPSPADAAALTTLPVLAGFVCLLLGDFACHPRAVSWLGFGWRSLPGGVRKGLVGSLIAIPWTFLLGEVVQIVYNLVRYEHPPEHEVLRAMNDAPTGVRLALAAGAIILVPPFEEYLFRGHLQTLLRRAFIMMSGPKVMPGTRGFPVSFGTEDVPYARYAGDSAALPPGAAPLLSPPPPPPAGAAGVPASPVPASSTHPVPSRAWQTWLAIVLTSVLFASVHSAWSSPMIFFLSVCLGYAYERTGSLWTNVTIHAAFNATSTALYLLSRGIL